MGQRDGGVITSKLIDSLPCGSRSGSWPSWGFYRRRAYLIPYTFPVGGISPEPPVLTFVQLLVEGT